MIGLGAAATIREIARLNDQFITLSNRVRIFADSQEESNQTMRELLDIAARTRTGHVAGRSAEKVVPIIAATMRESSAKS